MTALAWDQVGERLFETGVDRGVLFLNGDTGIAWNGLTSVEDQTAQERQAYYLDGVKFLERVLPGDYIGVLKAFTYPDELELVTGLKEPLPGFFLHDQPVQPFNLSYRTRVGNDVDGVDYGYRLHILYNVTAIPDATTHQTLSDSSTPFEFSWNLQGVAPANPGFRPTVHISIDSMEDTRRYAAVERLLYGTDDEEPTLPPLDELLVLFNSFNDLIITDNGDGTWTAEDPGDEYLTMLSPTEFELVDVIATYPDADSYTIGSQTPP